MWAIAITVIIVIILLIIWWKWDDIAGSQWGIARSPKKYRAAVEAKNLDQVLLATYPDIILEDDPIAWTAEEEAVAKDKLSNALVNRLWGKVSMGSANSESYAKSVIDKWKTLGVFGIYFNVNMNDKTTLIGYARSAGLKVALVGLPEKISLLAPGDALLMDAVVVATPGGLIYQDLPTLHTFVEQARRDYAGVEIWFLSSGAVGIQKTIEYAYNVAILLGVDNFIYNSADKDWYAPEFPPYIGDRYINALAVTGPNACARETKAYKIGVEKDNVIIIKK